MEKVFYRKHLPGYWGEWYPEAILISRNEKGVTIVLYNLRTDVFEQKHVKPHMVSERLDASPINQMYAEVQTEGGRP